MDRSEYSHLYHDSHFCSQSGVLEAREHLKAREVNAREQRLLYRQDRQLQQARDSCNRRHSWEVDNVRRDLHTILERTPTFDRSLRDEQRRMSGSVQPLAVHGYAAGVSNPPQAASRPRNKGVVDTFTPLPSLYKSFPKRAGTHLAPISTRKTDMLNTRGRMNDTANLSKKPPNRSENQGVQVFGMNTSIISPEDHHTHTKQPGAEKAVPHADTQRPNHIVTATTPPNHRHSRLADSSQNAAFITEPVTELPRLTSPDSPLSGATTDVPASQGQRKAALLRRRSHHAIMAIVRMKTRHELRRLQADVATIGQESSTGNMLVNTLSQSLTELNSVGSGGNVPANNDAACSRKWSFPGADQSPPAASMTSGRSSPSKGSWLSIPISLSDGEDTEAGNSPRDLTALRARPRFYSLD